VTQKRVATFLGLRDGEPVSGATDFTKLVEKARTGGNPKKSLRVAKWMGIWEQLLGASQLDVVQYDNTRALLEDHDDDGVGTITAKNLQRVLRCH